jgi:hypothetical protein
MDIKNLIKKLVLENLNNNSIEDFLKNKEFKNKKSKQFLYHGTNVNPKNFELIDDWDGNNGNTYMADLPEGYLFLTNDIKEARAYGRYIIPCEFKYNDKLTIKVDSNAPSQVFDDDFSGYGKYGLYSKFINGGKSILEVKGYNKSTFITDIYNVIPRVDLSMEFYNI